MSITPVDTTGIPGVGNGQNLAMVGIVVILMEEELHSDQRSGPRTAGADRWSKS